MGLFGSSSSKSSATENTNAPDQAVDGVGNTGGVGSGLSDAARAVNINTTGAYKSGVTVNANSTTTNNTEQTDNSFYLKDGFYLGDGANADFTISIGTMSTGDSEQKKALDAAATTEPAVSKQDDTLKYIIIAACIMGGLWLWTKK